ncbi:hypothetical protein G6F65_015822 [Rhizopus arrhizus]|nr:hypothetical protein G6F65_015822 [Rhizopus arrhizus]KAG1389745.1 hypothetical protein G6F59_015442 [Rhizopus arrhizus]
MAGGGRGQRGDLRTAVSQRAGRPRLFLRQQRAASRLELRTGRVQCDFNAGLPHGHDPPADLPQKAVQRKNGGTDRQRAIRQHGVAAVKPAQQPPHAAQAEYGSGQDGPPCAGPDRLLWASVAWRALRAPRCLRP